VWLGPGWPAARDPPGCSVATTTCGPTCQPKTPGFWSVPGVLDVLPLSRISLAARLVDRNPSRLSARQKRIPNASRQRKDDIWPVNDMRRLGGAVRWLGAGWVAARRRRRSLGRGRVGMPRCSAHTRRKQARQSGYKGRNFHPCSVLDSLAKVEQRVCALGDR
jgi:hypothetical protein